MEVYIEYVLIDNLVINFLIILFTKELLKFNITKTRMLLCSFLGSLFALVMPYLSFFGFVLFLFKLFVGVLLVSLLKKYRNMKEFIAVFLTFIAITFLFGGVVFSVLDFINAKTTNSGLLIYEYELPVGLILLIIFVFSYFIKELIKNFHKRKMVGNLIYEVSILEKDKTVLEKAFLDTGNRLVDKESKKPIVMINYNVFQKLYENINPADLLLGKLENLPLKKGKFMNVLGANGKTGRILLFETSELKIFLNNRVNIIQDVMLGLTFTPFQDVLEYSVLLNPLLFS